MFGLPQPSFFVRSSALFLMVGGILFFPISAKAQNLGVAEYVTIVDGDQLENGSIISLRNGEYVVTQEEYSKDIFGVVTTQPAVELQPVVVPENAYPVVKNGLVNVQVNGLGGAIKAGDLITSSSVAGQGMKASKSGFVLGVAEGSFNPQQPTDTQVVPIVLDIKFAFSDDSPDSERIVSRLMSLVSLSTLSLVEEPVKTLRYTSAALVVLGSLVASFLTFGRVAYKGVEAIGRNPLAKNTILSGVIINSILGVGLALIGLATAYLIVTW